MQITAGRAYERMRANMAIQMSTKNTINRTLLSAFSGNGNNANIVQMSTMYANLTMR